MAIKATIFKAELHIADMDRHYYHNHAFTIARHPSETDERMMLRLAAFALNASESLQFTKGISTDDEPDLWQRTLSDEIELWIELGQPEEKRIKKACGRAQQVRIYAYGSRSATIWWEQMQGRLSRFKNLRVFTLPDEALTALGQLAQRTMQLQCTIQDGQLDITNGEENVSFETPQWK